MNIPKLHDVRLMEINKNEEFYPKVGYIFIEMPKFSKAEGELETELDEWDCIDFFYCPSEFLEKDYSY